MKTTSKRFLLSDDSLKINTAWTSAEDSRNCYVCSGLMKPDTHLGENARQIEVSDDQTTPFLFC
ncbi:hypothetical protein C9422_09930 [Pseudomonas sp. B1(2018)]|nr:hypothetical protein C9422_09930 [Pseudomonas sp. B1(2018)]